MLPEIAPPNSNRIPDGTGTHTNTVSASLAKQRISAMSEKTGRL